MTAVLYCAGCRRQLAVAEREYSVNLYCSPACVEEPPVSDNESRDDLIGLLARKDIPKAEIARAFGITRQRASQITLERP